MDIDCPTLRVITESNPGNAAYNMAVDEMLLQHAETAVLRHYQWLNPAVSFGYFDKICNIRTLFPTREKVRRWTGGGIVLHGEDFTFSLVLPRSLLPSGMDSAAVYQWIHQSVAEALQSTGRDVELASECENPAGNDCFTNPVRADVLMDGRKVVGGALRRTRTGMLYQGSIQGLKIENNFLTVLATTLSDGGKTAPLPTLRPPCKQDWQSLTDDEICTATTLAATKYATADWNEKF